MSAHKNTLGRLSHWQAAFVIARRDFTAILLSRSFIFFLLGPLFPVVVMAMAGGVGAQMQSEASVEEIGLAMPAEDVEAMLAARADLAGRMVGIPAMVALDPVIPGEPFSASTTLEQGGNSLAAIVSGTLEAPELTATQGRLDRWQGTIGFIAAYARDEGQLTYPQVATSAVATSGASTNSGRLQTAQGGQLLLFLLIMLLASMVLSNLVEEKGNKIIEILAAAIPMDAVFLGKLFAMLAISVVGLMVWGGTAGAVMWAGGISLADYANPGVGWPMFCLLFAVYFGMGYLLLGAIFLAVGALASTPREVQTLSMPVTMLQILIFFFASLAVTQQGTALEYAGVAFPLSSPFVMVARAATDEALWPHLLALGWQALCVALFIRIGAGLFRRRVMKSGPQGSRASRGVFKLVRLLFRSGSAKAT